MFDKPLEQILIELKESFRYNDCSWHAGYEPQLPQDADDWIMGYDGTLVCETKESTENAGRYIVGEITDEEDCQEIALVLNSTLRLLHYIHMLEHKVADATLENEQLKTKNAILLNAVDRLENI